MDQASGIQGYSGMKFQRGSGVGAMFKSLAKWIIPLIKNYANPVINNAIKAGVSEIATGISRFNDDINDKQKDIKESASQRLQETVENIKNRIQKGSGKKRIKNCKRINCKQIKTIFE